jgi:hypothetical protein
LKRDELGVIYQLNVVPGAQRKLVGASLIQAVFDRSAYGCRLYCCWCAQDIEANHFWESLGFVPLAFRAGSDKKRRVHIFWQKRINDGDQTPWWYPFKTDQGALRADRIVFPIPPGVHWSEVRAVETPSTGSAKTQSSKVNQLPSPRSRVLKPETHAADPSKVGILVGGRIKYVDRPNYVAPAPPVMEKRKTRSKRCTEKINPVLLDKARELRDRWLERVNETMLISNGKYDVTRSLPQRGSPLPLLVA